MKALTIIIAFLSVYVSGAILNYYVFGVLPFHGLPKPMPWWFLVVFWDYVTWQTYVVLGIAFLVSVGVKCLWGKIAQKKERKN